VTYTASQLVEPYPTIVLADPSTGSADQAEHNVKYKSDIEINKINTKCYFSQVLNNTCILRMEQKSFETSSRGASPTCGKPKKIE